MRGMGGKLMRRRRLREFGEVAAGLEFHGELVRFADGTDERDEEIDDFFDIGEIGHFDHAVHIAEGDGDEGAGDAVAGVEDDIGIGAAVAGAAFVLDGDIGLGGALEQAGDDGGMVAGAVGDGGTAAEFDFAVLGGIDAGGFGGVGDIEDYADIWAEAMGGHFGAVSADFLHDGVDGDEGGAGSIGGGGEAGEDFGDDESPEAVIEGATDDPIGGKRLSGIVIDGWVTDAETEGGDLFFGIGADIDIEFVNFRGFFVGEGIFAEMDGGITDDAGDRSEVTEEIDAAPAGGGGIGTADAIDAEPAFFGDVFDDEADFVGVGFEHDASGVCGGAVEGRPGGPVGIIFDEIGEGFGVGDPFALASDFEAGGAWGIEEVVEELVGSGIHGGRMVEKEMGGRDIFGGEVEVTIG